MGDESLLDLLQEMDIEAFEAGSEIEGGMRHLRTVGVGSYKSIHLIFFLAQKSLTGSSPS
ncbi:hypothetical protein RchiOBHm_Chr6g0288061 [Rosa chinensis]|uniref:Uncharacterized protein n=1 Tax=Rosa chinensis TaxID=74649 RepID=A0A2P6PVB4_ROSCH|nr:hypothetical protein RchiOBHm_Chr6g0288061 [Rosa chinensis]